MTKQTDLEELAAQIAPILENFPANGQLGNVHPDTLATLVLAGFIERKKVTKPCKTCGTPKFDYSYFRITGGGNLFLAALRTNGEK